MQAYLPALVFVLIGAGLGVIFASINGVLGPRRPRRDASPYESGMPSDGPTGHRFGVSFYVVAILFLIFDIELLLLYPIAVVLLDFGWHAVAALGIFMALLGVAFVYEWRRGSLDWR